jgi:hypothetical protein
VVIRLRSVAEPFESAPSDVVREAMEVIVLAESMGLLEEDETVERLDLASVRRVARAAGAAGIATVPGAALATRLGPNDLRSALQELRGALEDSPAPAHEWAVLVRLFGPEILARLVSISPASLRRYVSRSRPTPDPVAARVHFLARVVADLKGAYNDIGIRRWFQRRRTALRGRSPAQVLTGAWDPDSPNVGSVMDLARSLASSSAT